MQNRSITKRLHIHSITDVSSSHDAEIADLFTEMREAIGLTQEQISHQLRTSPATIRALEEGEMAALPDWDETSRVITGYTSLLGLDPNPVLRRVMVQLPDDHASRPKTQTHDPSYDNMQSNANAVMNKVPVSQKPVESTSLPVGQTQVAQTQVVQTQVAQTQAAPAAAAAQKTAAVQPVTERSFTQKTSGLTERLQEAQSEISTDYVPKYAEFRAIPPDEGTQAQGGKIPSSLMVPAPKKRKGGFFVLLIQLLLLILIVVGGYGAWLYMNDPQGFVDYKTMLLEGANSVFATLSGLANF